MRTFKDGNNIGDGPNEKRAVQRISKEINWRTLWGSAVKSRIVIAKLQNHSAQNVQCDGEHKQLMYDLIVKIGKLHVGIYLPKCSI